MLKGASSIYLEYDPESDQRDKYDRILGWVFVDQDNLSELLVSRGYAEVRYVYGDYQYIDSLCSIQEDAYQNKLGIWSLENLDYYDDNYCKSKNF